MMLACELVGVRRGEVDVVKQSVYSAQKMKIPAFQLR